MPPPSDGVCHTPGRPVVIRQRWVIFGSAAALVVLVTCAPLVVPALPSIPVRGEWVAYGVLDGR